MTTYMHVSFGTVHMMHKADTWPTSTRVIHPRSYVKLLYLCTHTYLHAYKQRHLLVSCIQYINQYYFVYTHLARIHHQYVILHWYIIDVIQMHRIYYGVLFSFSPRTHSNSVTHRCLMTSSRTPYQRLDKRMTLSQRMMTWRPRTPWSRALLHSEPEMLSFVPLTTPLGFNNELCYTFESHKCIEWYQQQ